MAKNNLKPTPGYILIEPFQAESKTAGGIYLPENANEKPQEGKVLAVGKHIFQDGQKIMAPAKVNDVVIYKKWGGNEIKIEGKDRLFVKFEDILAVEG